MQINLDDVRIESGWKEALREEFLSEYFVKIKENLLAATARIRRWGLAFRCRAACEFSPAS